MPLYDYQCKNCGCVGEFIKDADDSKPEECACGSEMSRIISARCFKDDAAWVKSVLDVVSKDSNKEHVREFVANPTRTNYKKWMAGEGLRPLEPGENPARKDEQAFYRERTRDIMERRKQVIHVR